MEELDLKQLCKIFWNKRLQIIAIVVLFLIIGSIYSYTMVKPKYQSYTTLVLAQTELVAGEEGTIAYNQAMTQSVTLNQKLVSTYSELVKTKNVLREVIKRLRLDVEEETLRKNVAVTAVQDTELIKITVTNDNSRDAKNIANEIAQIFKERISEIYNINNVYIVDEAEEATEPSNISHIRDILIFIVIGLVISVAYVLLVNLFDTTVKSAEDIERELGVSVLASIPVLREESRKEGIQ